MSVLRRSIHHLLIFALSALSMGTQAQGNVSWQLPSAYSASMFQTENLVAFAADVARLSGGNLQIEVRPSGTMLKGPEIKPAVSAGKVAIGEIIMSALAQEMPVMGLDSIPFLASGYEDAQRLWRASKNEVEATLAKQGLKLLFAVPWPPQGLYSKRPVESIRDLHGVKFRTYNLATTRIAEFIGAKPVEVAVVDLPKAMAAGEVEAFFSSSATGVDTRAWEHLGYFYEVAAWVPKNVVMVNLSAFKKLSPQSQDALIKAATEAEQRGWAISAAKSREFSAQLAAKGMKVLPPPGNMTRDFDRMGEKLAREWLKQLSPSALAVVLDFLDRKNRDLAVAK